MSCALGGGMYQHHAAFAANYIVLSNNCALLWRAETSAAVENTPWRAYREVARHATRMRMPAKPKWHEARGGNL